MKSENNKQFQQMLENRRNEILRSLNQVQSEGRSQQGDYPQDVGDRSVATFSRELLFQQASQKRAQLRKVDDALERIRQGTYGECLSCGEQISPKRLEALPFTGYCRDCQENLERERHLENEMGFSKSRSTKHASRSEPEQVA